MNNALSFSICSVTVGDFAAVVSEKKKTSL